MDALALLCNLHADGPKTLQRLRSAGCDSIDVLVELDPADLADPLDQSVKGAERLQREARLLAERLGAAMSATEEVLLLDDEEEAVPELETPIEIDATGLPSERAPSPEPEVGGEEAEEIERVLDTWRDLDLEDPPEEPEEYTVPRPVPTPGAERFLGPGLLEGMGEELVSRLSELGIRSLQELLDANALALSSSIPLGYTRVRRFQFLARRACVEVAGSMVAAAETAAGPPPAPETAPAPAVGSRGAVEAAGPFA